MQDLRQKLNEFAALKQRNFEIDKFLDHIEPDKLAPARAQINEKIKAMREDIEHRIMHIIMLDFSAKENLPLET